MALKHPCAHPGCPALVEPGHARCPKHHQAHQQAYDRSRGTAAERGYDAAHRKWRAAVLARDPICKACGVERSTFADHIVPLNQGGAKLDLANGQGLCSRCHQVKRGQERHQHQAPPRRVGGNRGPGSGGPLCV
jgi:5-methylcytosine-specific restriction protein A